MEKRKRTKSQKIQQFGSVTIFVGKEEKEVQNLTHRTTVTEVICAVLKDDQLVKSMAEDKDTKSQDSESGKGSSSSETNSKSNENWVLVESWRGIERPLPPRTRLLKVWNSWKLEQRYVRFHLRKAATTSFRHVPASSKALRGSSRSRPRKHLRKTRPNFVGATETFIDGPLSCVGGFAGGPPTTDHLTGHVCDGRELEGTMATSSSSGSTSVTFSSDLSAPTTNTSSEDGLDNNVDEVRRIISICVDQQTRLKSLAERGKALDDELDRLAKLEHENKLRDEINEVLEKVELIEERISAVNNAKNGYQTDYQTQIALISQAAKKNKNKSVDHEKTRRLQTEIEAQLYLNLQLARKSDELTGELTDLMDSFESRQRLLDGQLKLENESFDTQLVVVSSPIVSEDSNGEPCPSPQCMTCPDCVAFAKAKENESDTPDSDSAVSSMSSADFNRLATTCSNGKTKFQTDKYARETLV